MNNVLVTGDRGFLGRHLVPELSKKGFNIYTSNTSTVNLLKYIELVKPFNIDNDIKFDYIFHLACKTKAGDYCLTHKGEQWENNQLINTNILKYWREYQSQAKMVAMGTSCSYTPNIDMKEDNYLIGQPEEGLYTYAMTKRMMYIGLKSYAEQYGLKYLHFIPSTLYGEEFDINDSHFIFDLIKKIYIGKVEGKPVELWGDGYQKRELVYVKDSVNIMLHLLDRENDTFNIGSGKEHTIREYANIICDLVGYDKEKIVYDTSRYVGVLSKKLNMEKLFKELPKFSNTSLKVGIEKTLNYYKEKVNERKKIFTNISRISR